MAWALAAAGLAAWAGGHAGLPGSTCAVLSLLAAPLGWGLCAWTTPATVGAALAWDGQGWTLDGRPGRVRTMVDIGNWRLLRFEPDVAAPATWMSLDVQNCGASPHACRVALQAHGGPGAAGGGDDARR